MSGEIGGGAGYGGSVSSADADTTVPSGNGSALVDTINNASAGETIYVPDAQYNIDNIDLSTNDVTVAGGRGQSGSGSSQSQSLLVTDGGSTSASPGPELVGGGGNQSRPITVTGSNCRFTGLRFKGPDTTWEGEAGSNDYASVAIEQNGGSDLQVDNCEGYGWSAVFVAFHGGKGGHVHHCSIHDNPGASQGYGVDCGQDSGLALIEKNYFNRNRHSIAAGGNDNPGYEVRNNIFGPVNYNHAIDQHGPDPAGGTLLIHNNEFRATKQSANSVQDGGVDCIGIRGRPSDKCDVYDNWFHSSDKGRTVQQTGEPKIDQRGRYDGSAANKGALVNMTIRNNSFGPSQPSGSIGPQVSGGSSPVNGDSFSV